MRRKKNHRARFHRRTEPGAPPGILDPDPAAPKSVVDIIAYSPDAHVEQRITSAKEIVPFLEKWPVTWINVEGLGDVNLLRELGELFKLHPLALEDVVHVHQRAKAEDYGDHYFVVARMPLPEEPGESEQISIFLKDKVVLTFQEKIGGDCFGVIRKRIRGGWGAVRGTRSDYLMYAILDAIVDHYFPLVEVCGERLDEMEELVVVTSTRSLMPKIHAVKRELLTIRRIMWPLRDAVNVLLRDATLLITDETRVYLRDVHDHTIQIIDLVENYRDITSGVTEVHLSSLSQRTNEIMKVLTVISTIFIPLTFIVGVYGMNFDKEAGPWSMPELYSRWGYPAVWAIMIAIAGTMLYFFHRRGWLNWGESNDTHE